MPKKNILLVDDEAMILKVLKRVVEASVVDCEVFTADSGQSALDLMARREFDVIVSDMRMPAMDGAELLTVVQELYPKSMRVVLSAKSGGSAALRTAGPVHQYFLKPDDLKVITGKINQVLKLRALLPEEGLDQVIAEIKSLPSLPNVYLELETELGKPNVTIEAVGRIIEKDVAMSLKVLQLVNSAFFGLREHVVHPAQAATLLGLNTIKSLVLAVHIFSEWKNKRIPGFDLNAIWDHSMNVAIMARDISVMEKMSGSDCEDIYAAGLFHDVGKLVLADNLPESWESVQRLVGKGVSRLEAEREVLGATHAETGAYLLCLWGFSEALVEAVAFHHDPAKSSQKGFGSVAAVHAANVLDIRKSRHGEPVYEAIDAEYLSREGLSGRLSAWEGLGADEALSSSVAAGCECPDLA